MPKPTATPPEMTRAALMDIVVAVAKSPNPKDFATVVAHIPGMKSLMESSVADLFGRFTLAQAVVFISEVSDKLEADAKAKPLK
jgi:hypothetical protein